MVLELGTSRAMVLGFHDDPKVLFMELGIPSPLRGPRLRLHY